MVLDDAFYEVIVAFSNFIYTYSIFTFAKIDWWKTDYVRALLFQLGLSKVVLLRNFLLCSLLLFDFLENSNLF